MAQCECGNKKFAAHQKCYYDVIVDENNDFLNDNGCYDSDTPYGPYICTKCGKEYEHITDLPK